MFTCEHAGISPDIMCIGKAITGGYMSFAATLCSKEVAQTISDGDPGIFMHGPTFMANPLACSVAIASLKLLQESNYDIARIQEGLIRGLSPLKSNSAVADVRILGAIGVVEMKEEVNMSAVQKACIEQGIWLRPFGKLIYTMPPFISSDSEIAMLTNGINTVINQLY